MSNKLEQGTLNVILTLVIAFIIHYAYANASDELVHEQYENAIAAKATCVEHGSLAYSMDYNEVTCLDGKAYHFLINVQSVNVGKKEGL
jgi:hypothetical protein